MSSLQPPLVQNVWSPRRHIVDSLQLTLIFRVVLWEDGRRRIARLAMVLTKIWKERKWKKQLLTGGGCLVGQDHGVGEVFFHPHSSVHSPTMISWRLNVRIPDQLKIVTRLRFTTAAENRVFKWDTGYEVLCGRKGPQKITEVRV